MRGALVPSHNGTTSRWSLLASLHLHPGGGGGCSSALAHEILARAASLVSPIQVLALPRTWSLHPMPLAVLDKVRIKDCRQSKSKLPMQEVLGLVSDDCLRNAKIQHHPSSRTRASRLRYRYRPRCAVRFLFFCVVVPTMVLRGFAQPHRHGYSLSCGRLSRPIC